MTKLLTALAAASVVALAASAAQADCYRGHDVTASVEKPRQDVAMSTYDGPATPPAVDVSEAPQPVATPCTGDADCALATK